MQEVVLDQVVTEFLEGKGLTKETASKQVMSDALAFANTYKWYIEKQDALPENAALAAKIWMQKYALHDKKNICLETTPEDMWRRIANTLAIEEIISSKEEVSEIQYLKQYPDLQDSLNREFLFEGTLAKYDFWYTKFLDLLWDWKYTPQGSGMYSLGNPYVKASASNCFVLPSPEDSLDSIFDTAKFMAKIYAYRGGVGHDLSKLRPSGAPTNNAAKSSTGASSFMDFYSQVTSLIGQAGRRGALMLSMRVDHPDVFKFIRMKQDLDKKPFFDLLMENGIDINDWKWSAIADRLKSTSSANVSVKLTDKFINAVKEDLDFELWFEYEDNKYPRYSETVKARSIWNELMNCAWKSAEPGIFNWDHVMRESIPSKYGVVTYQGESYDFTDITSNPCGEIIMSPDSCCLGSHYLPRFVVNPWTEDAYFDFEAYTDVVRLSTRAQDNIKNWDISKDFLLPIHKLAGKLGRRLGLGNHGLGDCLAMLGLKYNTDEAIEMAEEIYICLKETAYETSANLASEKGAFPVFDWDKHIQSPFIQRLPQELKDKIFLLGLRNIAMLTNAPTGSVSILCNNCTSGIEPLFSDEAHERNVKKPGTNDFEKHYIYPQGIEDCKKAGGDPSVYVPTYKISGPERVKMQATIQRHIDHSISVTTNLPSTATVEQVSDLYMAAFDSGCKGFTIYVDGSRTGVLTSSDTPVHKRKAVIPERPKTTNIDIHKVKYKEKNWAVLIGYTDNGPLEVFAGIEEDTPLPNKYHRAELTKKSRGHYSLTVWLSEDEDDIIKINNIGARFPAAEGMTLTRFISLSLRNGIQVSDICEQLQKSSNTLFDYPAVLNRVLKNYITEEELNKTSKPCPECGKDLKFKREGGCMSEYCESCSYSNSKC